MKLMLKKLKDSMNNYLNKVSRKLITALRHKPFEFNLPMTTEGWVPADNVLKEFNISHNELRDIVFSNDKNRFQYDAEHSRIRAVQGHSLGWVKIKYPQIPSSDLILYHGTNIKNLQSIGQEGLKPMKRNYVHLSTDVETALDVGSRHADEVAILKIDCRGLSIYEAPNLVYLAEHVPSWCIRLLKIV